MMPFQPTFWSKGFGMVVDRFGLMWMVTVPRAERSKRCMRAR